MKAWLLIGTLPLVTVASASSQVVLNEVLPAPGTDWNQTGDFSSQDDEWIEIYNGGGSAMDVTGWLVGDGAGGFATPRYGLADTLQPGAFLFVTGELAGDWETNNGFPSVGLSLNNSGDVVYLFQTAGGATTLIDSLAWSGSTADVSVGRMPDGTGAWTDFDALTAGGTGPQPTPGGPNGGPASPKILSSSVAPLFPTSTDSITVQAVAGDTDGISQSQVLLCVNGGPQQQIPMALVSGAAALGTWEHVLPPYAGGTSLAVTVQIDAGGQIAKTNPVNLTVTASGSAVTVNEILADPPAGLAGDANGDGVRGTADDEFVEVVNASSAAVDITGWTLQDATAVRHTFPSGSTLLPGEIFVVFGGGAPAGIPSGWDVASSGALSLNNTGDSVQLVGADAVIRDAHAYGSEANADQSLIRVPDGTGPWTRPADAGFSWAFSPGAPNVGTTAVRATSWSRVKSLYRD